MIRAGTIVTVNDASQVAEARRIAAQCATNLSMNETTVARVSLVATELATNLIKHANGGSILIGGDDDANKVSLIALDKAGGIANVPTAMQDGFSTAGSPGTGLGAIGRTCSSVDIYSMPQRGTAVMCIVEAEKRPAPSSDRFDVATGGICIPKSGESQPGDAWSVLRRGERTRIIVADGLGHGDSAAKASLAAVRVFHDHPDSTIEEVLARAHEALRPTRGAAIGIAEIHPSRGSLEFVGVGNIAGTIYSEESVRKTVSHNGIVGHQMGTTQKFPYVWRPSSVLIMQSDGVGTSWNLERYPGLSHHDPALIASVIFRDHCRGTDDATVVVAKAV